MLTPWRRPVLCIRLLGTRSYARIRPRLVTRAPAINGNKLRLEHPPDGNPSQQETKPPILANRQPPIARTASRDAPKVEALELSAEDTPSISSSPSSSQKIVTSISPALLYDHWDLSAPSAQELKESRAFFLKHRTKLLFSAERLLKVPFTSVPEVAFLGRSNVGKSSLINRLFNDDIAKVSQKPGKTKVMNAYNVGDGKLTVLDMPGYGRASREEWGKQITKYLEQRKELRRVFVLIDCIEDNGVARIKKEDVTMLYQLSELRIPHQIVITKADRALFPKSLKAPLTEVKFASAARNLVSVLADVRSQIWNKDVKMSLLGPGADVRPFGQLLAVTTENTKWTAISDEARGALGIDAVRWAILVATGHAKTLPSHVNAERNLQKELAAAQQAKSTFQGSKQTRPAHSVDK